MSAASHVFRTSALALACTLGLAAAEPAQAVNVSPSGLGQVLLFPYYTVNGGLQTLVTVTNTTDRAKAVRVHFREARNGKAALWFNLYLGAHDVWTAAVYAGDSAGAAQIVSDDSSCTVPRIQGLGPVPFRNYAYTGASNDGGGGGLERTRDGYIEMIDMGSLQPGTGALQLAEEVAHGTNGAAPNCAAVIAALTPGSFAGNWADNPAQNIDLPSGGLIGDGQIVDVANGSMVAYRATALSNFYTNAAAPSGLHSTLTSEHPDLRDADSGNGVATARLLHDDGISATENFPLATADAVSFALLRSALSNTYIFDPGLGAATDWVATFPTKRFHTDVASNDQVRAPFTNAFRDDGRAAEIIALTFYSREQQVYQPPGQCPPGLCDPPPPLIPEYALGASANVVAIGQGGNAASAVLRASIGATAINIASEGFSSFKPSGWLRLQFDNRRTEASEHVMVGPTTGTRYAGLPAIGFAAFSYINNNAQPGLLANYAGGIEHVPIAPIETPRLRTP